jgi:hypothetical protein
MNHLLRELAPINEDAWASIEDEAKTRLTTLLAARKLVDFEGPHGWSYSATNLGRVEAVAPPRVGSRPKRRVPRWRAPGAPFAQLGEIDGRRPWATDSTGRPEGPRSASVRPSAAVFNGYGRRGWPSPARPESIRSGTDVPDRGRGRQHLGRRHRRPVRGHRPPPGTPASSRRRAGGYPPLDHLHQIPGGRRRTPPHRRCGRAEPAGRRPHLRQRPDLSSATCPRQATVRLPRGVLQHPSSSPTPLWSCARRGGQKRTARSC